MAKYKDFILRISKSSENKYVSKIVKCPNLPANKDLYHEFTLYIKDQLIHVNEFYNRFTDIVRHVEQNGRSSIIEQSLSDEMLEYGNYLFETAFSSNVYTYFKKTLDSLKNDETLRICLDIKDEQVAQLPWEFISDPSQSKYRQSGFALKNETPIMRGYYEEPMQVDLPINILLVASLPLYQRKLNLDEEIKTIRDQLKPLVKNKNATINVIQGEDTISQLMNFTHEPIHILHFLGHSSQGSLLVEDEGGKAQDLVNTSLTEIIGLIPSISIVILNACLTSVPSNKSGRTSLAYSLSKDSIPYVIGMQFNVSDAASIAFSKYFYQTLAKGSDIFDALTHARVGMKASLSRLHYESSEWGTPVLFVKGKQKYVEHSESASKFFNRDLELDTACKSGGPSSILFLGPASYGKTRLIDKIIEYHKSFSKYSLPIYKIIGVSFRFDKEEMRNDPLMLATHLLDQILNAKSNDITLSSLTEIEAKIIHGLGDYEYVLVCFDDIDLVSRPVLNWIRDLWLRRLQAGISQKKSKIKVICTAREKPRTLTERDCWAVSLSSFSYQPIKEMLTSRLPENFRNDLSQVWEVNIISGIQYLTAGHPKCIHNIVSYLNERSFLVAPDYIDQNILVLFHECIQPVIEELTEGLSKEAYDNFKRVCVLRHLNIALVNYLFEANVISVKKRQDLYFQEIIEARLLIKPSQQSAMWTIQPVIRRMALLELELEVDYEQRSNLHQIAFDLYRKQQSDASFVVGDIQIAYMVEALYHKCEIYRIKKSSVSMIEEALVFIKNECLPILVKSVDVPLSDRAEQFLDQLSRDMDLVNMIGSDGYERISDMVEIFIENHLDKPEITD